MISTWASLVHDVDHVIGLAILTANALLFSGDIETRLLPARASLILDVDHVIGLALHATHTLRFSGHVVYRLFST
jgi:hypothetical protein